MSYEPAPLTFAVNQPYPHVVKKMPGGDYTVGLPDTVDRPGAASGRANGTADVPVTVTAAAARRKGTRNGR